MGLLSSTRQKKSCPSNFSNSLIWGHHMVSCISFNFKNSFHGLGHDVQKTSNENTFIAFLYQLRPLNLTNSMIWYFQGTIGCRDKVGGDSLPLNFSSFLRLVEILHAIFSSSKQAVKIFITYGLLFLPQCTSSNHDLQAQMSYWLLQNVFLWPHSIPSCNWITWVTCKWQLFYSLSKQELQEIRFRPRSEHTKEGQATKQLSA